MTGDDLSQNAWAVDLSGGGVRISSLDQIAQGAQLRLQFGLPNTTNPILAHGRVVMSFFDGQTKRFAHGIVFTQIAQAHQEAIVQFVRDTGNWQL